MSAVPVACASCGWRSRRARSECACYDEWALSCSCAWGRCIKCNGRVLPTAQLTDWRKTVEEGERYYREHKDEIHALADAWLAAQERR